MTRKLRVAHVLFRLDYGGLENGVVNIINRLPPREFDHTIITLTHSTDFRSRLHENIRLVELKKPPGNSPIYLVRLWKVLRSGHFDIVHTRNLACLEPQLAAALAGVPVRIHGEHGWDVSDLAGAARRYRLLRRAFRPFVHRYVALSAEIERYLVQRVGVDPARIARIGNGVDARRFQPAAERPAGFVVGSVGRMELVKDYMNLARAFVAMAEGGDGATRLLIAGGGSQRAAVGAYLQEHGPQGRWELPGPSDDVPALLGRFSVFVLPSLAEGMSNTILEAMASGLPVVATDVGGNRELVSDGETGFLVPAGDSVALHDRLVFYRDHPQVAAEHGRAARQRVLQHFSLASMVALYRRLYLASAVAAGLPATVD